MKPPLLVPDWHAPARVHACTTTRAGGVSLPPYESFNLGDHVGDAAPAVAVNRARLAALLPGEPLWLEQVHGVAVADSRMAAPGAVADAAVAREPGRVCAVLTADCLPVLFCDRAASVVAAAHAGWRGLAAGVLEAAVAAMAVPPPRLMAWLGPAIGKDAYEVGEEVYRAFVAKDAAAQACFTERGQGKWLCDLAALACLRLHALGVTEIAGGSCCTFGDPRFYSHRRDGITGRIASLIWLAP